jgi:hypothetical protein
VRAVCVREAVASTAIVEIGVSVPHARLAGVVGVIAGPAATPTALYQSHARRADLDHGAGALRT